MRVVLQRVSRAEVRIDGRVSGSIGRGYVLLAAFSADDDAQTVEWMADKVLSLRLFSDDAHEVGDARAATGDGRTGGGQTGRDCTNDGRSGMPEKPSSFSRDITEVGGELLVVSQFTLYGDARRGRRPSFIGAAPPAVAVPLYESFVAALHQRLPGRVATGEFGAMMDVELVNDGPVTLILERQGSPA